MYFNVNHAVENVKILTIFSYSRTLCCVADDGSDEIVSPGVVVEV